MSSTVVRMWVQLSLLVSSGAGWLNQEDEGGDAVEYALIIGLIAFVIIAGLTALGGRLNGVFTSMAGKLATG